MIIDCVDSEVHEPAPEIQKCDVENLGRIQMWEALETPQPISASRENSRSDLIFVCEWEARASLHYALPVAGYTRHAWSDVQSLVCQQLEPSQLLVPFPRKSGNQRHSHAIHSFTGALWEMCK